VPANPPQRHCALVAQFIINARRRRDVQIDDVEQGDANIKLRGHFLREQQRVKRAIRQVDWQ
jgi:hypothetical protein